MRIIASVITFHPDFDKLKHNINTYAQSVEKVIVFRNSDEDLSFLETIFPNLILLGDGNNSYIAKALNTIVQYCIQNHYDYLLTMDQDSSFNSFDSFITCVEQNLSPNVVCYAPALSWFKKPKDCASVSPTKSAITSGSIMYVPIVKQLGGFREDYKIYEVDLEFCYWARENGYTILLFYDFVLNHNLGYQSKPIWKFSVWNYSPSSYYFLFRNRIWMQREYSSFKEHIKMMWWTIILYIPGILLGEKHKCKKIGYIIKAFIEGYTARVQKRNRESFLSR